MHTLGMHLPSLLFVLFICEGGQEKTVVVYLMEPSKSVPRKCNGTCPYNYDDYYRQEEWFRRRGRVATWFSPAMTARQRAHTKYLWMRCRYCLEERGIIGRMKVWSPVLVGGRSTDTTGASPVLYIYFGPFRPFAGSMHACRFMRSRGMLTIWWVVFLVFWFFFLFALSPHLRRGRFGPVISSISYPMHTYPCGYSDP